jgi:hypothetical protein
VSVRELVHWWMFVVCHCFMSTEFVDASTSKASRIMNILSQETPEARRKLSLGPLSPKNAGSPQNGDTSSSRISKLVEEVCAAVV